jgi:AraC-like DNA-binding protein
LAYDKYNDALWIGANEGVFLYDLKTGRIEDPFPNNRNIRGCIGACIDHHGHLWMGCLMGVCDIDLKAGRADKGKFRYRHLIHKLDKPQSPVIDKITCIYETKDGTLWLGSDGYGLYRRLTEKGGQERFEVMTTDDGLSNNAVKGIVDDANGRLWITTNNGLSVYDPHHHTFVNYGERDGLLCQRFYWNSAIKDADGVIYLGSIKGLTAIRGENTDITSPVHLSFTHLVVDNQEITAANSSIIDSDISLAEKIRLHESNKSFSLSFSALSSAGQPQQFVCRLKGFEDDWTVLKPGEHTVRYTSLKPGTYLFEVKNATETGLDGNTISIKVEVVPYFWKSWWFILLCLMVLSGIFVWLYRLRLASLRRQEAEKLMQPVRKALEESDDPVQLQSRIQNILDTHEYLMQSFHRTVEADKQQTVKSKGFMERATEIMEQNYGNSEFGIDEFAEALGMSRSLVSKRLNHEAGQSTSQFIRNYRLSVAKRLLLDNWANRNITEIAYKVGFNDPKYFTRCFTRQYGCSPSAFVGEDEKVDEK